MKSLKKIVITGGAGFIGSHIVDHFVTHYPEAKIVVLDKMTYAADIRNLLHHITNNRIQLLVGNLCHLDFCTNAVADTDLVIHAAAESHVDNSFGNSLEFTRTNVVGTHALIEACRQQGVKKIIHISTDEVYGELHDGAADEGTHLRPTNPYSASKAAADMIINGFLQSYKLPVIIVRANNIFGIRQFPEKIIPKFCLHMLTGQPLTIHGSGENRRHYLSALDFAEALDILSQKGTIGEVYNVGTTEEYTNIQMAHMICEIFGADPKQELTYIQDRPFNDFRYAVKWDKLAALGWKPHRSLKDELGAIAQWYCDNIDRYESPDNITRKPVSHNKRLQAC